MYTSRTARKLHARLFLSMSLEEAKKILGFSANSTPSSSEISKAYKRKVLENHPDRGGDPLKMVEVNVAKEVLDGKFRNDFIVQRTKEEEDRERAEEKLRGDIVTIRKASEKAVRAMSRHSLFAFAFRGKEPFRSFLMDQFADVLDLVQEEAEKSLKSPTSKDDEKALRKILALVKEMDGITLRIASKYRGLSNPQEIRLSDLEEQYTKGKLVQEMMGDLFSKSKQVYGLIVTGLGPNYDDSVSISEAVADRYFREGSDYLGAYVHDLVQFDPKEGSRVLKEVESAVTEVLDLLKARKVDLNKYDLSSNWKNWDIPDSFELSETAIRGSVKNASLDDGIALRVASRFVSNL